MTDTAETSRPPAEATSPSAEAAPPSTGPSPPSTGPSPPSTEAVSPYLGLRSFAETDRELFHGREAETDELFHLVQRETLSVVFGMSGLGKSSLLRAGLFPRLREASLFPIAVRLTYGASDLVAQIRAAIASEIAEHGVDASRPPDDQTLWEYFHRTPFWSARNRPLIPVLVFDQFEELFTLGQDARGHRALLTELGDLVENRIPEAVRRADDADGLPPAFQVPKAKVILSLREDYLARLEDLRAAIPSIARGRFRLRPMDGAQAVRAVRNARTEHLVDAAVAGRIVRFVAGAHGEGTGETTFDARAVEPALLSLVCRQLDEIRALRKEPTISSDLLTGESARILDDFYERSIADLDPSIIDHIEWHLLTPDGHRTTVAMSSLASVAGVGPAVTTLIDRRILRIEGRLGRPHVEIIHDVLTRVMMARRDRRRSDRERRRRLRRWIARAAAVAVTVLLVAGAALYLAAQHRLAAEAERQRAANESERRTNAERAASTLAAEASAMLSRGEVWSAARLLDVAHGITKQDSSPELAMLVGRITALHPLLAAALQPGSDTTAIAFSGDGTQLFAGHRDGSVSIWSTADWTQRRLAMNTAAPTPGGADAARSDLPSPPRRAVHAVDALAISDDGRYAAVTNSDEITVRDTRTPAVFPVSDLAYDGAAIQVSGDAHWLIRAATAAPHNATLLHLERGRYVKWRHDWLSERCWLDTATHDRWFESRHAASLMAQANGADDFTTRLAISGDGSTLAVFRHAGTDANHIGELSVFRRKDDGWELLASRCELNPPGFDPQVNFNGTAFGLHDSTCSSETDGCASASIVYRWAAPDHLEVVPGLTASTFDARRPDLLLGQTAGERASMTLDGRMRRMISAPCTSGVQADLVDGRLAMIGPCGGFTMVDGNGPVVTGELPVTDYTALQVSAAAALAAVVSSDGVIRVWKLDPSPDRVVQASSRPSARAPLASITPFTVGPPSRDGALAVSRDGRQLIAGTIDRSDLASQLDVDRSAKSTAPAPTTRPATPRRILGIFEITHAAIRPLDAVMEHPPGARGEHGVTHVELSPDEQRILSVGSDRRARVWRRDGSQVFHIGDAATEPVRYARYSPDGQRIATLGIDRTCLWNASDGHRLDCIESGAGRTIDFDRTGAVIAGDKDGSIKRWDIAAHTTATIGHHADRIERIDTDPTGRWVASAGIDALQVWDLDDCKAGGCRRVAHVEDKRGFERARFVGKTFVLGIVHADRAHVIDLTHPDLDLVIPLGSEALDIDVSPDGRALLCEADGIAEEWDLARLRLTGRVQFDAAHADFRWCAARYLRDGRLVTQFSDGSLAIWPAGALAVGIARAKAYCWRVLGRPVCDVHDVAKVLYDDAGSVIAYDGDLVRLFSASGELLAAARSAQPPVAVNGGAAFVSPTGQLGVLSRSGQLQWMSGTPGATAEATLARDPGSGELLWIDRDLHYRWVHPGLDRGIEQRLTSNRAHGGLQAIEFAPLGSWILAAYADGTLTRLDMDGRPVRSLQFPEGVGEIVPAIHGDGLLAVGSSAVEAWSGNDVSTEIPAASGLSGRAAAWDMAANAIVLGTHKGLERFDLATRGLQWRSDVPSSALFDVTWVDLDGRQPRILTAALDRMSLVALDNGRSLHELPDRAIAPDALSGSWFVEPDVLLTRTASSEVELWNLTTGKREALDPLLAAIAGGPPNRFAVYYIDKGISIARVENHQLVPSMPLLPLQCGHAGGISSSDIAWSADFKWVAAAKNASLEDRSDDLICLWDAATGATVASWGSRQVYITHRSFSHDGRRLLTSSPDGPAQLWEVPTGRPVAAFEQERLVNAAFVRGQPYILTEDQAKTIHVYDARSGTQVAESPGTAASAWSAIDETAGWLMIADRRGGFAVIDIATGKHVFDLPPDDVHWLTFAVAFGGRALAINRGGEIWLWSLFPVASPPVTIRGSGVAAMAFSPDGRWLATAIKVAADAGGSDAPRTGMLRIRKVSDGTQVLAFPTDSALTAVSWSSDGSHVVVGGEAGFIETFDLSRETRDHDAVAKILDRITPRTTEQAASPSPGSASPAPH